MKKKLVLTLCMALLSGGVYAEPPEGARFAIGLNTFHFGLTAVGSSFFPNNKMTTVPVDAVFVLSGSFGIMVSVVYRYEKEVSLEKALFAAAIGPRLAFAGKGLPGLYVAARIGAGIDRSTEKSAIDYEDFDLVIQPEIGYTQTFRNLPLLLEYGLGVLILIPLTQTNPPHYNDLGNTVHYRMPVLKVSIGLAI
jgi:hypothetical protein